MSVEDKKDSKMPSISYEELTKYEEESHSSRLLRKAKDSPYMVAGLVGLSGIAGYGFYGLKTRNTSLSLYLVQLRVRAQGFVVACLTCGLAYGMFSEFVLPKLQKKFGKDK